MKKSKNNHIILFDGVCNLCNSAVLFLLKRDKKAVFSFASLQSETAVQLLKKHNYTNQNLQSIVYISHGTLYAQSTAALRISQQLSGGWKYCYYLIFVPKKIRDAVYTYIANHRYQWFGKKEQCAVPSKNDQHRFL
ncbi:MAG: hypothetical protein COB81_09140 [Flavobacteriaceae bacterium]|nr:MAG: hypothetical protein COB81_09140 [Flavobacteriaceae bacterium]